MEEERHLTYGRYISTEIQGTETSFTFWMLLHFPEMYKHICVPSNVLLYLLLFLICNVSFSEAALSRDLPKILVIDFRFTSCTVGVTSVWLSGRQCENQSVMLSTKTFHSSSKQRTHRC